jgi:hypothetical protein
MKASKRLAIANPPLDLRLVIALDVPLLVEPIRFDPGWDITIPSVGEATLHMPSFAAGDGPSVTPPSGFERVSPDWIGSEGWGRFVHPERVAQIGALGFCVSIDAGDIESEIPGFTEGFLRGELVDEIKTGCVTWRDRFCRFGQLLLNQPLDITDPGPGIISRPGERVLMWADFGDIQSRVDTLAGRMTAWYDSGSAVSELVASPGELDRMVALTDDPHKEVPIAVALLSDAILAIKRHKLRQAIIDLGGAVEAILTNDLSLPASHKLTLRPLTENARRSGLPLPTDLEVAIVDPRNDAIHRSIVPTWVVAVRAVEIVEELLARAAPEFSRNRQLQWTFRPTRGDLLMLRYD